MRQEIAADRDEVGLPLPRPRSRLPGGADPGRRNAEVEVREMHDPEAVELGRQPGELQLEHAPAQPAGFEQAPARTRPGEGGERSQTSSRSSAGRGSTMW